MTRVAEMTEAPPPIPLEAELIAFAIVPHLIADGATPTVPADSPVESAARLLAEGGGEALAVLAPSGRYLGLVGLRHITRAAAAGMLQRTVAEIMQPCADWLAPDDTPLDALELLRARGVEHLPVLELSTDDDDRRDGGRFVGIVSLGQLVRLLHRQFDRLTMQRQRRIFGMETDE